MPGNIRTKLPLLLCSLGNPGTAYAYTRHNAGHVMLDLYRASMHTSDSGSDVLQFYRSSTFMNESGLAVSKAWREFTRVHPDGILCVLHDEMETPAGVLKLRLSGKGKGHNGIRSCIKHLGTEDFARLAIGIGRPASRESSIVTQWVLGKFNRDEMDRLEGEGLMQMYSAVDRLRMR